VFATKISGSLHTLAGVANTFKVKSGNGTPTSNTFDWGDATTAVGLTAVKSYPAPGSYTVATNTTDSTGAVATQNRNVLVAANPVVAGEAFSCALNNDATVSCWGLNDMGRTGQSFTLPSSVTAAPTVVAGLADVGVLAAGDAHACAIKLGGTVWCWGNNNEGQLGNGTGGGHVMRAAGSFSYTPVQVPGIVDALAISAGYSHTCAILRTGLTVICWGNDSEGQLGRGRAGGSQVINSTVPVAVVGLSNIVAIAAGVGHTCAIAQGGQTSCWGSNSFGQLGDNTLVMKTAPVAIGLADAKALSLGRTHSCAIRVARESIQCWGDNRYGQLGNTSVGAGSLVPVQVTGALYSLNRAISANLEYTCALRNDGTVSCWGDDRSSFGTASTIVTQPTAVAGVSSAVAVAAGTGHGCALQSWGDVMCWGGDASGRLGRGPSTNAYVYTPASTSAGAVFWHDVTTTVTQPLAIVGNMSCAIKDAGGVQCWDYQGQNIDGARVSNAYDVTNSANVIAIKGGSYLCAVFDDGRVGCATFNWTPNSQGTGYYLAIDFPTKAPGIAGAVDVTALEGITNYGGASGCAVIANGKVKCWGYNDLGAHGYPVDSYSGGVDPVAIVDHPAREVPGVTDAISISSNRNSVCVLKRDTTVMCWGRNEGGQLGNNVIVNPNSFYDYRHNHTPTTVAGLTGVLSIDIFDRKACAAVSNIPTNSFYCWGYVPRLSWGPFTPPTPITELSSSVKVAVSHLNDCGIQADTKVKCAGNNMYGELGTTTGNLQYHIQYSLAYYSTGTTVPNLIGATVLSNGSGSFDTVCILNTSGQLLCWGGRILLPSDPQFSIDSVGDAISLSLAANPTPTASPSGAIFWRP
jgi:alpha-tubulin suppressor-like RCC1 family protein